MATTADSIPIIDLRLLSQLEINSLAVSSPNSFNLETLSDVVPKIDRSVFNESAGSRKQTYSRLPLSQSQSQSLTLTQSQSQSQNPNPNPNPNPSLPRRRGRPRLHPLPATGPTEPPAPPDLGRQENLQIVCILKKLFESREKEIKSSNSKKNDSFSGWDRDKEVRNGRGEVVDLAALAEKGDIFGEEIRRRTDGLRTEEQILGYMTGLDGQWGSRRKRRKVVDAAVFGDGLPKGWKVLLGLKRKEGIVYLNCRRYVSPSGKQFMSCKEVSSYILSLNGQQDAGQPISGQHGDCASRMDKLTLGSGTDLIHQDDGTKEMANCSFIAPISYVSAECQEQGQVLRIKKQAVVQPYNSLECQKCNITFGDKDAHLQHLSTFHQRSAKRRKLGKSITDGVIVKDGKYECQFCHKSFTERHRYNGHIGAHIRYEGLGVDASPLNITARTSNDTSSLAVVPYVSSETNISVNKNGEAYTPKSVNNQNHIDSPRCISQVDMNEIKHNPKAGGPEITEAVSSDCKTGFGHNPMAGASEITEAVTSNSKKEIEQNPMAGAPEITEAVSSSKFIDSQIEDCKITYNKSKEIMKATNVTDMTSNACTDAISPCGTDMNNMSHTCSPIVTQEASTSESVHDQINGCKMSGAKSGVIEDINVQDGKPNVCLDAIASTLAVDARTGKTISEAGLPSSKSTIINGNISDHIMDSNKSENNNDTSIAMSNEIAEETGHFSSKDKFVDGQINDCDITGYKSEVVDPTNAMTVEANACTDALSPSLINVDNMTYENSNIIDPSSCTVVSMIENCNGDQKICEEYHLLSLSAKGQNYGVETCAREVFTSKVVEHVEFDASIYGKSDTGSRQGLTNQDTRIASTMHNELNTSYVFTNIASEPTSGIETNADCMFPGDVNTSLLDGIDRVGNELQNYFHRSNVCNEDDAGVIMSNGDGRQALQVNMADQSSTWVQSSESVPILDLISDQCRDELRDTVPSNEQANMSGFEELRLGGIEPADFVLFTGQASGSVTRSPMELFPDDQLGWGMSLAKMGTTSVPTSVCVWCSREFNLEGIETEQQSESLGYICPDCKTKISGQFGLLNNGFSL